MTAQDEPAPRPDRREVLTRLMAVALAGVPWTAASAAEALRTAGGAAPAVALPRPAQRTLAAAAEVIVPRTTTPGALEAGVPAFVAALYRQWMTADERAFFAQGLAGLDSAARSAHQRAFAACSTAQREALLQALREAQPFKGWAMTLGQRIADPGAPFFTRLRDLVVFGYFTSEAGSTQVLRYLPAPGSYDGNVKMKDWPYQLVL